MGEMNFFTANAALQGKTVLDVEALTLMYRLEMAGERFYQLLVERVADPEAKELLGRNGREENAHARRIARAISIKTGSEWTPSAEVAELLAVPLPDEIPVDVFKAVVEGEIRADGGYQAWADNEPDPEVERLLRLNGREESIHGERVTKVIEILSR
jgi:rubrerythrin